MSRGWFITFEGGEGSGKSTQLRGLEQHLVERGFEVVVTREPGGTPLAEAARAVMLDPVQRPDGLSELFLLAAARHDHVERVIRPALARGAVVLCDRYTDSSVVYQGVVRGVGEDVVDRVNSLATGDLEPDLTLIFDMDPIQAVARAHSRNALGDGAESRLDNEPAPFHVAVRQGYLGLARRHPHRIRVVDAAGPQDEVLARAIDCLPAELR